MEAAECGYDSSDGRVAAYANALLIRCRLLHVVDDEDVRHGLGRLEL